MDKAVTTQLANIEKRTGKSLDQLTKIVRTCGRGMCQVKVRLEDPREVDRELIDCLCKAYDAAG